MLRVDPEQFDLARFERLVGEAQAAPAKERAELLRGAIALWRGEPLEDLAFEEFAQAEIGHLQERLLNAIESRIDADLELGRGPELVDELEDLITANPLRERLRGQLMLALYRAGRQADALAAYQDARRMLADELGLEPSAELRTLEHRILGQDRSLSGSKQPADAAAESRRVVTVLFWATCFTVGTAKTLVEQFSINPSRLVKLVPAGQAMLAVDAEQLCGKRYQRYVDRQGHRWGRLARRS